jgi:hypothetical protein
VSQNHAAAVALHFIHYNFARIHKTLRITPAMAAGLSDHVWNYEEIAGQSHRAMGRVLAREIRP